MNKKTKDQNYIYSCEEVMNTSRQHILYRDITK